MLRKLLSQVFSTQRARETPQRAAVAANGASGNDLIAQLERARACEKRGDPEAALACYQACAASYPDSAPAHLGAANALSDLWRMHECIEASGRAAVLEPQALPLFSALLYHSHFATNVDPAELFRLHRDYGERVAAQVEPLRTHANSRELERKLRIAYVSANFSRHSVGYFVEPLLA